MVSVLVVNNCPVSVCQHASNRLDQKRFTSQETMDQVNLLLFSFSYQFWGWLSVGDVSHLSQKVQPK